MVCIFLFPMLYHCKQQSKMVENASVFCDLKNHLRGRFFVHSPHEHVKYSLNYISDMIEWNDKTNMRLYRSFFKPCIKPITFYTFAIEKHWKALPVYFNGKCDEHKDKAKRSTSQANYTSLLPSKLLTNIKSNAPNWTVYIEWILTVPDLYIL